ncbi:hypothetical protein BX265_0453 [Streptomyces sp. TLI_235]|nr:hypothetical protein BX265_0453 [Streptomyces sp. TLI_235]
MRLVHRATTAVAVATAALAGVVLVKTHCHYVVLDSEGRKAPVRPAVAVRRRSS